ncbi:MAG: hypothetical protein HZY76_03640 [Anaerolineae bacterium]|nr:MAG: hypothetical protein HZY76_03640 [Anaerolineae bacterium]
MLVLNFSHPITPARAQIESLTGEPVDEVRGRCRSSTLQPLADQALALVDAVGLSAEAWQTTPLIVNPPGLAPAAMAVLAELHGRTGYFPSILRLRTVPGTTPTRYEVAEIINLQALRAAPPSAAEGVGVR